MNTCFGDRGIEIIAMAGVHFMGFETTKCEPPKKVFPDIWMLDALFVSITRKMLDFEKYPGVPVVSYVNASADVKAEADCLLHLQMQLNH